MFSLQLRWLSLNVIDLAYRTMERVLTLVKSAVEPKASSKYGRTLESIIAAETCDFHSDRTGGTIHKLTSAQIDTVAYMMRQYISPQFDLAMLAAVAAGESRFDPAATCPNMQTVPKGVTQLPHVIFLHTDVGFGQFDVKELISLPAFAGLTDEQVLKKAEDLAFAIPHMCSILDDIFTEAAKDVAAHPEYLDEVPNRSLLVYALERYNVGNLGAELLAQADEKAHTPGAGFSYGAAAVERYHTYCAVLGITPSRTGFKVAA